MMYTDLQEKAAQIAAEITGENWQKILCREASIYPFENAGIDHINCWKYQHSLTPQELGNLWAFTPSSCDNPTASLN